MDPQVATLDMMYCQTVAAWVQAGILLITAGVVGWYAVETKCLRQATQMQVKESQNQVKESQRQTELQLRPFVILGSTHEKLYVKNVGNGTALNVRVRDTTLVDPRTSSAILRFPEPVATLLRSQEIEIRGEVSKDGRPLESLEAKPWIDLLKRSLSYVKHKPPPAEITIDFENVEKWQYFVKETLVHGELNVLDSGRIEPPHSSG